MSDNQTTVPSPDPATSVPAVPAPGATPGATPTTASSVVSSTMDKAKDLVFNNAQFIIVSLIVVAAGAFLVAYLLYWAINNALLSKKGYLVSDTKIPKVGTELTKISGVSNPISKNGKRMTVSFWIYIHDIDKYKGAQRHILHIGDEKVVNGSPVVYLGRDDNKMYIAFNSIKETFSTLSSPTDEMKLDFLVAKYGIVIDYIPIQRWVHVAIVINEDSNNGSISAYIDAELVKTLTTGTKTVVRNLASTTTIQDLTLDKAGALFIGGSTSDEIGPGFSGLVSKVKLFNYDLNVTDVYAEYRTGPVDNLLARLGLPAYGVRSPVYRIG
jgi:hypothetical protein